jgi:UDP-N-acetylglucosamine 1-carboxyvinyltransferase
MVAAAATGGRVKVHDLVAKHMECIEPQLYEMGVQLEVEPTAITVSANRPLRPISFTTEPYPGFPTDMHPQMSVLCSLADGGMSTATEGIFGARFQYTDELIKMGVDIVLNLNQAKIFGRGELNGAVVKSHDLRAGAAMVIAGLAAKGRTVVEDPKDCIARGYLNFAGKLKSLGANIVEE